MKTADEKYVSSAHAEGAVSVLAVLRGDSRPIHKVLLSPDCDREHKNVAEVLRLCREKHVPVEECSREEFCALAGGSTHGGLIAEVGERKLCSLSELLTKKDGFFFMLCGIEDPYNFGDAVRSLYAFGADGMVLTPRNWLSAAAITIRSSAGATELMDCAVCEDEEELANLCKENGVTIVCAGEKDSVSLHRTSLKRPMLVVIGGEKRGISRYLLNKADLCVRIPYGRNFNQSLSASAAAAALGFELSRQQRQQKFQKNKFQKGKGRQ